MKIEFWKVENFWEKVDWSNVAFDQIFERKRANLWKKRFLRIRFLKSLVFKCKIFFLNFLLNSTFSKIDIFKNRRFQKSSLLEIDVFKSRQFQKSFFFSKIEFFKNRDFQKSSFSKIEFFKNRDFQKSSFSKIVMHDVSVNDFIFWETMIGWFEMIFYDKN